MHTFQHMIAWLKVMRPEISSVPYIIYAKLTRFVGIMMSTKLKLAFLNFHACTC